MRDFDGDGQKLDIAVLSRITKIGDVHDGDTIPF